MTFVGIRAGSDARPELTLRSSQLSPRVLRTDERSARVALVGTTALLLAGDHVHLRFDVGPGCRLDVVDTAGTVAYDGRGGAPSTWTVDITVADGGLLTWQAEPFVVAAGADVTRTTRVELAPTATTLLRETVVLGRSGEPGGALWSSTRVRHDGQPLLAEDLDLTTPARHRPGLLGAHRVVDTAALYGRRATDGGPGLRLFQLAGAGTVARHLGVAAHRSGVAAVADRWRRTLDTAPTTTLSNA